LIPELLNNAQDVANADWLTSWQPYACSKDSYGVGSYNSPTTCCCSLLLPLLSPKSIP